MQLRSQSTEIPTSSMADIAFLLIIYFMVTATFTATRGLDIGLPEEDDAPLIDPVESIHVLVQADGTLQVNGRATPIDDLLEALRPNLAERPDKPVILDTDPAAPYGAMTAALDELRQGRQVLGLAAEINLAIPTQREMASYW